MAKVSMGDSKGAIRLEPSTLSKSRRGKKGYGIDEHRTIIELSIAGVLSVAIGFLISFYTSVTQPSTARLGLLVGPSVGFLIIVVAVALYWSSRLGKVREMDKMIDNIPWGGEEVVLDLGCGRGLGMVLAAKKLNTGMAIGVDTWRSSHLSGNNPASIWTNASIAGVDSKVTPVRGLSLTLPFANKSIDVVVSGVAIHRLV